MEEGLQIFPAPVFPTAVSPAGRSSARVELVRGRSATERWFFDEDVLMARLDVGSARGAAWRIEAEGVRPHHFDLMWDGQRLWIASDDGEVTLNGEPVSNRWRNLSDDAWVQFGDATVIVWADHSAEGDDGAEPYPPTETGEPPGDLHAAPTRVLRIPHEQRESTPPRVSSPELSSEPTVITELPVLGTYQLPRDGDDGDPIPSGLTVIVPAPMARVGTDATAVEAPARASAPAPAPKLACAEPTRIVELPADRPPPAMSRPPAPRLGSAASAAAALPWTAEETRLTTLPEEGSGPRRIQRVEAPAIGGEPGLDLEEDELPGDVTVVTPLPDLPPPAPFTAPAPPRAAAPLPVGTGALDAATPLQAPATDPGAYAPATHGADTGAPPSWAAGDNPFLAQAQALRAANPGKARRVRPLTWVLFAVTVSAAAAVALLPVGGSEASPAHGGSAPAAAPADETAATDETGSPDPEDGAGAIEEAEELAEDGAPVEGVIVAIPIGAAGDEDGARPMERQAVDLLIAGHHTEALMQYELLSAAHPDDQAYALVVRVLRERIRERCQQHELMGDECEEVR